MFRMHPEFLAEHHDLAYILILAFLQLKDYSPPL
jgi:hypothetical protein